MISVQDSRVLPILQGTDHRIRALAVHEISPFVSFGDCNGFLQLWNYKTKKLVSDFHVQGGCKEIECMDFDRTGVYLACGTTDGSILVFDVPSLKPSPSFECETLKYSVTMCKFSPDSQYLVTADSSHAVSLFRIFCIVPLKITKKKISVPEKPKWEFIGRQRQHYMTIVDVTFNEPADGEHMYLFSLGKDRVLVVYDITDSTKEEIKIHDLMNVEQVAVPHSLALYPLFDKNTLIAIANNEFKLKVYDFKAQICIKTTMQPLYDTPIQRMSVIKSSQESKNLYLVYATEKRIGLTSLPADGNPYNSLAVIAHPTGGYASYIHISREYVKHKRLRTTVIKNA